MPDRVEVELQGVEEFNSGVQRLGGKIDNAATREFGAVASSTAGRVSGSLPHRTGALAASTRGQSEGDHAFVGMGEGVRYAQFVEYGGRGFPASAQGNYLYPAAQDAEPLLVAAGERAAAREIGAMTW